MAVIVVMGVAGAGKSTIGTALAGHLGVEYAEADEFHPAPNIEKMTSGVPLTDADRWPWLRSIADWIRAHAGTGGVVTCSALKYEYRDVLRGGGSVWFLHLDGARELLATRMGGRSGHFMPTSLLDSQLADLSPLRQDEHGRTLDIGAPPGELVDAAITAYRKDHP
ncbi:gluconokinase [Amycolatopsis sp. YIM 10]|uniref:gluconokinase n=1 Tax=Amycolatopsis sp. YIM 10 TaxID=2653857 RepID=UPI00128FE91B|nr:gluconokinase [Amycolatopsis sp. YIM 10]QFU89170.1 Thermoresistant gluconokinase [Amycolatopsis sp. YIM 10]